MKEIIKCYHCGNDCNDATININDKVFCCNGCKTVYEILESNDMCTYYTLDEQPGLTKESSTIRNFDFLDDPDLKSRLIDFTDGKNTSITFHIPQMHCSSCIWILENMYKLNKGIRESKVNFLKKTLSISYNEELVSLREIVELLDSIGYLPALNLEKSYKEKSDTVIKKLYYKIGIAGFAFGNIMLLSFPEYLSLEDVVTDNIKLIFGTINMFLALPVFFYSASEYYLSAWKGLRKKIVNIDVPITMGIFVLFLRSYYELFTMTGAGYLDSLAALVFFLLIGKLFQHKTYEALNFERNFQSYFPIAVTYYKDGIETTKPVEKLEVGERILIRNAEIIPADSVLISETANIDYSFVTGESKPVERINGDLIYAGGRLIGSSIEVETVKEVSQSYLTQLWNQDAYSKKYSSKINSLVNTVSKYFTAIILLIALLSFLFWIGTSSELAFNAFTAVLIIACPCALALSTPFTLGNTLRIFGRNKFYVKNTEVIETMASIESIVFDKTGTITESGNSEIKFIGDQLSREREGLIYNLARQSSHPLSKQIVKYFNNNDKKTVKDFTEISGRGLSGKIESTRVQLGSKEFVNDTINEANRDMSTRVYISIDNIVEGYFKISNKYRNGLKETADKLKREYDISVLSGDNESERENLKEFFGEDSSLAFNQSPFDKLEKINELQKSGKRVLMLGDGLNDAGALKQSDVGVSISEDINNFSPACDAILESKSFIKLKEFIRFSRISKNIIILSFIISFIYNIIGLGFAVQGTLSPVIAAILMPLSSISVVVFTTFTTNISAKKAGLL